MGNLSTYIYRQFLAQVQREHPALRLHLAKAWMVVAKWEKIEPTVRRTPVPEALLRAMVSLAWCWGWRHVAAVLAFTFYSASRVGEVLLQETQTVYLRILHPKARNLEVQKLSTVHQTWTYV